MNYEEEGWARRKKKSRGRQKQMRDYMHSERWVLGNFWISTIPAPMIVERERELQAPGNQLCTVLRNSAYSLSPRGVCTDVRATVNDDKD